MLAQSPCAEVTRCSCGHIHLAVGPVTLRLEEDVLRALGHTLLEAIQHLEETAPTHAHAASDDRWKQ
ncbi:hypothetical protein [Corallococcus sp. CA053C]|uniref:hypothetical protein n=1 Tax=Corallococcus sp. CA053C TaxID=2316732 RepID=UPI0011C392C6|nr:hypothetical protein [Corallococcus sp. CA053C]